MNDSRTRAAAAAGRLARLKRIDRAAVVVITFGGLAVVASVLGILLFIAAEAVPLFRSARLSPGAAVDLRAEAPRPRPGLQALGVDEYRRYLFRVDPDARVVFFDLGDGSQALEFPVPGLAPGTPVRASSRSQTGNYLAAATDDGRVALMQVRYTPRYAGGTLSGLDVELRDRGVAAIDPAGRAIREVSYLEEDGRRFVAALVSDAALAVWWTDDGGMEHRATADVTGGQTLSHVRVGRNGAVAAATDRGRLYHWIVGDDGLRLTDIAPVADEPITALEWLIGGRSLVAGTAGGRVSSWFRAAGADGQETLVRAHDFEPQESAVVRLAPSPRERSFAALGADGALVLRHQTSERTLARLDRLDPASMMVIAPKADALYLATTRALLPLALDNPHPEVSWRTLAGKVWYEGYAGPEYVWQSTGATDDFEPKLSLVPLLFGTIKATFYAMLFAIPLGVLGALYASQFVHPKIRARVKPAVEIMAALPSVVIGFLAGLYLASVVERHLVAIFVMLGLVPLFGTGGLFVWRALPARTSRRLKPGAEIIVILPLLAAGMWASMALGPLVEQWIFAGDARAWLQTLGLTYDQRNSLVIGIAMGFAVIPIIFTIAEDAFTSVPSNLSAASLALGASRWQTAVRVVLPTASPGVCAAVMIGFGRAVGETMIVLMATGNTPVMDWSIFNGMRTLSANIAVEIAEAPYGGTLYRTLFLSAALLFTMTFVINTIAEVVRQRLRDRYKAV